MEKEQLQELIENNKEDIFSEIKDEISDDTVTDKTCQYYGCIF